LFKIGLTVQINKPLIVIAGCSAEGQYQSVVAVAAVGWSIASIAVVVGLLAFVYIRYE